jgi:hypothetical protein
VRDVVREKQQRSAHHYTLAGMNATCDSKLRGEMRLKEEEEEEQLIGSGSGSSTATIKTSND